MAKQYLTSVNFVQGIRYILDLRLQILDLKLNKNLKSEILNLQLGKNTFLFGLKNIFIIED